MNTITIKAPYDFEYLSDKKMMVELFSLSQVSDGYHTIEELYNHRITLYIALCKAKQKWMVACPDMRHQAKNGYDKLVWRSKFHSDGSIIDGWFILGIGRKKGEQITYHIPMDKWDDCDFAETLEKAPKWDKHTSDDVLERLAKL